MLNHGTGVLNSSNSCCKTLNTAAYEGLVETVRELPEYGACAEISNKNIWTALIKAA